MYPDKEQLIHVPVMLDETIAYLRPEDDKIYVDCTFGAGGYSRAILSKAKVKLFSIDCDPDVKPIAREFENKFPLFKFLYGKFSQITDLLKAQNVSKIDGIILDLGVSSMQLDNRERGFSFMGDADLDMRMSKEGLTAGYVVNNMSEEDLANIIYNYGDDRDSRKIARKICAYRINREIKSTFELAEIVRSAKPKIYTKIDQATKTFQALRIYINEELEELKLVLSQAKNLLNIGGKLIIVSFHSLEDKIVKNFIKKQTGKEDSISRYEPYIIQNQPVIAFKSLTKGALAPNDIEIKKNPRSRSAKFRAIEKVKDVSDD